ncbi:hypothetical protein HO133_007599 [Letharia lupina]|uniref:Uncharacterized protein n=1 Tax=Letharia lupina TaxID=560253 RepID=A0A8H6FH27_9LECA|nr:uncharacterized protein HO133_007599 [Letharia lupina]KAF6227871.1 hypothetical protein HO133_007599 [Letharia lupina]
MTLLGAAIRLAILLALNSFVSTLPAPSADTSPPSLTLANQSLTSDRTLTSTYSDAPPLLIEFCGTRKPEVERALLAANRVANSARLVVGAGIGSPEYKAMFENNAVQPRVAIYLKMIYDYRGSINLKPAPQRVTAPRIACATPGSAKLYSYLDLGYDPWQRCAAAAGGAPTEAFYADGSVYIFLCPRFFQQPLAPFGSKCPELRGNLFAGDVSIFYRNYQVYTLFYEFVRLYLGTASLNSSSIPRETFDWNQCVGYSLLTSIKNPTNYVLFAALVAQGCTAVPDPEKPPFSDTRSLVSFNASMSAVATA